VTEPPSVTEAEDGWAEIVGPAGGAGLTVTVALALLTPPPELET